MRFVFITTVKKITDNFLLEKKISSLIFLKFNANEVRLHSSVEIKLQKFHEDYLWLTLMCAAALLHIINFLFRSLNAASTLHFIIHLFVSKESTV